jgi:hypothetical protein
VSRAEFPFNDWSPFNNCLFTDGQIIDETQDFGCVRPTKAHIPVSPP